MRPEVVTTTVWDYPTCWVVGYQSRAFLERGSLSDVIVGGGPIIINKKTGKVRQGTSGLPKEEQLDPD
jgi:hypothetical protein